MHEIKDKVKKIVNFFHHSVKASDKLSQLQQQHGVPVKKLIQDVETGWNSTYHMLERFADHSNVVTTALYFLGKNYLCLSNEEFILIKKAIVVLEYFDEATKEVSAEKFTSVSKVLPIVSAVLAKDAESAPLANIALTATPKRAEVASPFYPPKDKETSSSNPLLLLIF